jgi:hypothetical protein
MHGDLKLIIIYETISYDRIAKKNLQLSKYI